VLVLTRRTNESIVIGDDIVITVLAADRDRIKLGVSAPRNVMILRKELYSEVQEQNLEAAQRSAATEADSLDAVSQILRRSSTLGKSPVDTPNAEKTERQQKREDNLKK
jgi:carbon storage regulator